jgi:hypothetical protein
MLCFALLACVPRGAGRASRRVRRRHEGVIAVDTLHGAQYFPVVKHRGRGICWGGRAIDGLVVDWATWD